MCLRICKKIEYMRTLYTNDSYIMHRVKGSNAYPTHTVKFVDLENLKKKNYKSYRSNLR